MVDRMVDPLRDIDEYLEGNAMEVEQDIPDIDPMAEGNLAAGHNEPAEANRRVPAAPQPAPLHQANPIGAQGIPAAPVRQPNAAPNVPAEPLQRANDPVIPPVIAAVVQPAELGAAANRPPAGGANVAGAGLHDPEADPAAGVAQGNAARNGNNNGHHPYRGNRGGNEVQARRRQRRFINFMADMLFAAEHGKF